MASASPTPGLLSLPLEIRLNIYNYLLIPPVPEEAIWNNSHDDIRTMRLSYHAYEESPKDVQQDIKRPIISLRTIQPTLHKDLHTSSLRRRTYKVRSDRFGSRCMDTTYACLTPTPENIHPSILAVCHQTHEEAAALFYSSCIFDFDSCVEAVIPFLEDLTPVARSYIRHVRLVKSAVPYEKEFDRCEWRAACRYLGEQMQLKDMMLGVVAGKPGSNGWDEVDEMQGWEYDALMKYEGMEWLKELVTIKGLTSINVNAIVEHCPHPGSALMESWIRFSKSIDGNFAQWLQRIMIVGA